MKIVILVSMFPPAHIGGAEIAAKNIAKGLVYKGHEVFVITSFDKGSLKQQTEDGFLVNRISYPKIKFFGIIIFWLKCLFLIKKINPAIIHVQGVQMGFPAFLAKKILGVPYVLYCRGSDVYYPWAFKKSISKMVFNAAASVVALTNDMKNEIGKNFKKNIVVIPNGVNLSIIREVLKQNSSEKVILFVGSLRDVKGVKYLIEAFKIINQVDPQIKLFLVGDGGEKQNLEDTVKENNLQGKVNFVGRVENDEIPKYMAIADIFVLPSLSEGFPMVILEAMASGLPIIATNVRGLPEIIKDGENGFLVPPKNPEQIAEKVTFLLQNDELRKKISNNNKEKAKEYSWDNIVNKIEKAYLEVISENHGK